MALIPRLLLGLALLLSMVEIGLNAPIGVPAWAPWLGGAVHAFGLARWVRRPGSILGAALALAPLALGGWWEGVASPSGVHHGKLLPIVVLAALLAARVRGGPTAERDGVEAACGAVAATYTLSVLSKAMGAGLGWFTPGYLGLLFVERAVGAWGPLAALRVAFAEQPTLCVALAVGAWAVEGAGALFVWAPARKPVAVALAVLHAGIAVLMGYVYVQWVLVLVALAWCDGRRPAPTAG